MGKKTVAQQIFVLALIESNSIFFFFLNYLCQNICIILHINFPVISIRYKAKYSLFSIKNEELVMTVFGK